MKKNFYILITAVLLCFNNIFSQDISQIKVDEMSDEEVAAYWQDFRNRGLTLNQVEALAKEKGLPASEFLKFRQRISSLTTTPKNETQKKTEITQEAISEITLNEFGHNGFGNKDFKRSTLFGFDFFSNPNVSFTPNLNLATPSTYQLGPGDEVLIDVWGAAENKYHSRIENDGAIRVPNVGPIYISGISFDKAKEKIISHLSKIYRGINSPNSSYNKINVDVSLVNVRTVQINIIGEVKVPGTYSLSALSSVLNALYAAGGPTLNGTFREIRIYRDSKLFKEFDIYKYLTEGDQKGNVFIRDQDIIIVKPYKSRIEVKGKVKRPGLYELKEGETMVELVNYFGGFKPDAYTNKIIVERIEDSKKIIKEFSLEDSNFKLKDGDKFSVEKIIDRYANRVSIYGAVYRPGQYPISDELTVYDLLNKAEGLLNTAFLDRAIIYRNLNDVKKEIISFSLNEILNKEKNIKLQKEDRVQVFNIKDLEENFTVSIDGAINKPQSISYVEKMQVEDLIALSGGYKVGADPSSIIISRRINDGSYKTISESIKLSSSKNLNKNKTIYLKPFDKIFVRYTKGFTAQKSVSVSGEVNYPGKYSILNKEEKVSDLIERAGGLSPYAFVNGATLIRKNSDDDIERVSQNQSLNSLNSKQDTLIKYSRKDFNIGLNLKEILKDKSSKYNLILKDEDRLVVPSAKEIIIIEGEVLSPTAVRYDKSKSLKDYINNAGGYSDYSRKSKTYVVYANGEIKSTKRFLIFKSYPKLEPGALIIVPNKAIVKNRLSLQEGLAIATSITTLGILINNLTK